MRADRLVATLLLMQARGRVTAAEVAAELEVSVATARRDLEALSTAGVPVYPQPGRGGGWSLVGGARTDLTGLTVDRGAGPVPAGGSLVGPVRRRSALRKLVRALPETFRADAEAAADAVVVDPRGGASVTAPGRRGSTRCRTRSSGVARSARLRRTAGRVGAVVDPWGLVDKDDVWYLVAGTPEGQRTFRVDRIVAARRSRHARARDPTTSTSPGTGSRWSTRSSSGARALGDGRWSPAGAGAARPVRSARDSAGRRADGRVRCGSRRAPRSRSPSSSPGGAAVEVLEPESVRAELARLGAELVARYVGGGR